VVSVPWADSVLDELAGPVGAFVVAAPVEGVSLPDVLCAIRQRAAHASVLVVAVVDTGVSDQLADMLYGAGVQAVVGWPHEARVFPRLLVDCLAAHQVRGVPENADRALERVVVSHLKLLTFDSSRVSVRARGGTVRLSGFIRTLWEKRQVVRAATDVTGVRAVSTDTLRVGRSALADHVVLRRVREALSAYPGVEESTLSPTVHNGYVTVAGAVGQKADPERIRDVVARVRGVRGIEMLTTISKSACVAHRLLARHLSKMVSEVSPDADIHVECIDGVTVLSGRAPSPRAHRAIAELVAREPAVERLVDNVET